VDKTVYWVFIVSCTAANVVLTWAGTPTIVGNAFLDLVVTQVPASIITLLSEGSRLERLEKLIKQLTLSQGDWGNSDFDEKEPELPRASVKLSDSVVDLITSKLRK